MTALEAESETARSERGEILAALERASAAQVAATDRLTATVGRLDEHLTAIARNDEAQDRDLERVKEICHQWMRKRGAPAAAGAGGIAVLLVETLTHIFRYLNGG